MTHPDYRWPEKVVMVAGMAPGEMRLVQKVAGAALDELDSIDQVKSAVFVALLRDWREHHPAETPDGDEIWDRAEWTELDTSPDATAAAAIGNPTSGAG